MHQKLFIKLECNEIQKFINKGNNAFNEITDNMVQHKNTDKIRKKKKRVSKIKITPPGEIPLILTLLYLIKFSKNNRLID